MTIHKLYEHIHCQTKHIEKQRKTKKNNAGQYSRKTHYILHEYARGSQKSAKMT